MARLPVIPKRFKLRGDPGIQEKELPRPEPVQHTEPEMTADQIFRNARRRRSKARHR